MPRRELFKHLPFWTASSDEGIPFSNLSKDCQDGLVDLVKIFHDIDCLIINEINQLVEDGLETKQKFLSLDPELDLDALRTSIYELSGPGEQARGDLLGTLVYPKIRRCNETWSTTSKALLKYQGSSLVYYHTAWGVAKVRALPVLKLQDEAWEVFSSIEEELVKRRAKDLRRGIALKIESLDGFETVYNRQPSSNDGPKKNSEPTFVRHGNRKHMKERFSVAYSQRQQNLNSTLIVVVLSSTLLSFIPIIFAWQQASNSTGTTHDVDFWLLIQSSMLQLLGLFTVMFPIYRRSPAHAWRWAQALTAVGALCSLGSIPLYLYTPTMWSALVSFFGSAAQAGMALLLALMADSVVLGVKED